MSDLAVVLRAAHWAAQMHQAQRRKGAGAHPYINHPIAVTALLTEAGVTDAAVLCGALLHDVVEDTAGTLDDVRARFGDVVAGYVAEVSDDKALSKAARKQHQIDTAASRSPGAKLIKLADKTHNVRDLVAHPPSWPVARLQAYVVWSRAVVAGLRGENAALDAGFDAAAAEADAHFLAP